MKTLLKLAVLVAVVALLYNCINKKSNDEYEDESIITF